MEVLKKTRRIRVLHLVHWLNRGGIEVWVLNLLKHMPKDRFKIDICCKGPHLGSLAEEARKLGATLYHCPLKPDHISFYNSFYKLVSGKAYDIVHIHTGAYSGFPAMIAKKAGAKTVVTYHNTNFVSQAWSPKALLKMLRQIYVKWSIAKACKESDLITFCSEAVRTEAAKRFNVGDSNKHRIWYCGTPSHEELSDTHRTMLCDELNIANTQSVVIHVGSFREQKNHVGLLKVAKLVSQTLPSVRFLLIGSGPLESNIKEHATRLNLSRNVQFLGTRSDVPQLLRLADVFFFPSLWEGLPVTIAEAQMAGLPIVGSNIPSIKEGVLEGQTALLARPNDEETMSRLLIKVLTDKTLRSSMAINCRKFATAKFSIEISVKCCEQLYKSLLHGSH